MKTPLELAIKNIRLHVGCDLTGEAWEDLQKVLKAATLYAEQQKPDRSGQLELCASGLISLLYQEPDDVKQIREYIVPELRKCLTSEQQKTDNVVLIDLGDALLLKSYFKLIEHKNTFEYRFLSILETALKQGDK